LFQELTLQVSHLGFLLGEVGGSLGRLELLGLIPEEGLDAGDAGGGVGLALGALLGAEVLIVPATSDFLFDVDCWDAKGEGGVRGVGDAISGR
jgi:hypothetical protein